MTEKQGFTRREFLKLAGATAGVALSACSGDLPQKLIPYIIQPEELIPGVAVWYAGVCAECRAGCGLLVRTREGRPVKLEGNPLHPINQGALCAIGQSALQTLYDPDRVREPLQKDGSATWSGVGWDKALEELARVAADGGAQGKETVLISRPLGPSERALAEQFCSSVKGARLITYDAFEESAATDAAALSFSTDSVLQFDFAKADIVVSFSADYLGPWGSSVEQVRAFTKRRSLRGKERNYAVHFEPRLSLTAANADHWHCIRPGSEPAILSALLAAVAAKRGRQLPPEAQSALAALKPVLAKESARLKDTGVTSVAIDALARRLVDASSSLVVAGGSAVAGEGGETTALLVNALNWALQNFGSTIIVRSAAPRNSGYRQLAELVKAINENRGPAAIIIAGVNPVFNLPSALGLASALRKTPYVAVLGTNIDETAAQGRLVLPLSTGFESWNDSQSAEGVWSINQPAMQPLYPSQSIGDFLIALAAAPPLNVRFGAVTSFEEYLQERWRKRLGDDDFARRWTEFVAAGGDFRAAPQSDKPAPAFKAEALKAIQSAPTSEAKHELTLLAFPTASLGSGSGANRPWLQELPEPVTKVVWGSWAEIHPKTAQARGIGDGDAVRITTAHGVLETPALVTPHIDPDTVAVPIGQGHEALGRFARGVGTNPLQVLAPGKDHPPLFSAVVRLERLAKAWNLDSADSLVRVQLSDSQHEREILRTVSARGGDVHEREPRKGAHHGESKHQMYVPLEPVQYHWGMSIDLSKCTGCSACVVACYAENNVPVAGKQLTDQGRSMAWIRVQRFMDGPAERPVTGFMPMLCQHCGNAPCEPVCPVYATYHNDEGLNTMVYNRCVGTRYCANNCSYKVRRFNWVEYSWPEPLNWQLNPDVTVRSVGVMEKCTFCVQRIREAENLAKDEGREVRDGEVKPACASTCPSGAITFGNLRDRTSTVALNSRHERGYRVLEELNTEPAITYLAKIVDDGSGKE